MAEQLTTSGDTAVSGFQSITVTVYSLFQMGRGAADGLLAWRSRRLATCAARGEEVVAHNRARIDAFMKARRTAMQDARQMAASTVDNYIDSFLARLRLPSTTDLAVLGKELDLLEQKLAEMGPLPVTARSPAAPAPADDARAQEIAATVTRIRAAARARRQTEPGAEGGV